MLATQEFSPRYPPEPVQQRNLEAARSGLVSLSILIDQNPDLVHSWTLESIRGTGMRLAIVSDVGHAIVLTGLTFADLIAKLHTQIAARREKAGWRQAE